MSSCPLAGPRARSKAAGVPVTGISAVTGFPEIMDGRVKTLHPAVHGGILARRGRDRRHGDAGAAPITPIDIVVVNLYPFVKAAARPDIVFDALVEEIDIGGPSMVRSAAKNFQDVLVVVDPADYPHVLAELERSGRRVAGVPFRARAQSVCAHSGLRHGDRRNACGVLCR